VSSHHFVKEGQEPAVFIADEVPYVWVEPLLEWSPLVMVHATAVKHVLTWGIKIDIVFAEPEQQPELTLLLADHAPIKLIEYSPASLLETVFFFSLNTKQKSLAIITTAADQFFLIKDLAIAHPEISVITAHTKWSLIQQGKFEKWIPAKEEILIHAHQPEKIVQPEDGFITIVHSGFFWVGEKIETQTS
jgi:hypothetical protein